jgi:glucosamine--fructose-6-phosphate aminotransferase (isomerizing)
MFTLYERPPRFGRALVLGISQSGKSPDIVSVLAEARRQGNLTAALTNEAESDLAQAADFVLALHAGQEQAVAATKTYTAELAAIALISAALAQDEAMLDSLRRVPDAVRETLGVEAQIAQIAPRYRYMTRSVAIGRGYNYSTAFEIALKLKEMTYTVVEPYSSADFLHGPLAMIEPGFPVIMAAAAGVLLGEMQAFIRTLQEHKAEVLIISDDADTLGMTPLALPVPGHLPEWLTPITMIVPGQLLSLHLAAVRGYDIDRPRSIHKVTETV